MVVNCRHGRNGGKMRLTTIDYRIRVAIGAVIYTLSIMAMFVAMPFLVITKTINKGEIPSLLRAAALALMHPKRIRAMMMDEDVYFRATSFIFTTKIRTEMQLPPLTFEKSGMFGQNKVIGCVYEEDAVQLMMRYGGKVQTRSAWRGRIK